MTVEGWLRTAVGDLSSAGIATARLDALVLLEDITGKDRAWLLAHNETEIEPAKLSKLNKLLRTRAQHIPLSYVRGVSEFYGRNFVITPAVLEPRPESETMIDLLKEVLQQAQNDALLPKSVRIADVGTGSGALGITAKLEHPEASVDLLEVDAAASEVAKMNVDKFTLSISVIVTDLLSGTSADYHVLLCNLPYVPDDYHINTAASHEPALAIFGGPDGLDIYRRLFLQLSKRKKLPLFILTESLPPQHNQLSEIAHRAGYRTDRTDDFIQVFRLA